MTSVKRPLLSRVLMIALAVMLVLGTSPTTSRAVDTSSESTQSAPSETTPTEPTKPATTPEP
ncbi:MAG: hypothetical protein FWF45_03735, partial [Coriobacteriia bacterium]|nr:hypothetical protein [Coriobacteriia bacterium]